MSTSENTNPIKPKYHHGDLTNALKQNAIDIINKKGVSGLNLRDLASSCNVSATAVYRHYKSKSHLLAALAEEGFYKLKEVLIEAKEPNRLQKMGVAYIHFALKNSVYFNLMFGPLLDKKEHPLLLKTSREAYEILRAQIKQSVLQGLTIGNVDGLTRTAWATVHGTAMLLLDKQFGVYDSDTITQEQIITETTAILRRGFARGL